MSLRDAARVTAFGRLALFAVLVVVATVLSVSSWNERSSFKDALYKAYPEYDEQRKSGQESDKQTSWVEARQAWLADAAFDVAVWQLILSFFGIAGVAYTVRYARLAWIEAEKSASAAQLALKHSEESAERQLRAYITVELRGVNMAPDRPLEAAIQMFNRGQTPARNIVVKWATAVCPVKPSREQIESIHASAICPEDDPSFILGPNEDRGANASGEAYEGDEVFSVLASKGAICVAGAVEYLDAFDRPRRTRFCHIYIGGDHGPDGGKYYHYGNDYT
jgi:hypothetical protein